MGAASRSSLTLRRPRGSTRDARQGWTRRASVCLRGEERRARDEDRGRAVPVVRERDAGGSVEGSSLVHHLDRAAPCALEDTTRRSIFCHCEEGGACAPRVPSPTTSDDDVDVRFRARRGGGGGPFRSRSQVFCADVT